MMQIQTTKKVTVIFIHATKYSRQNRVAFVMNFNKYFEKGLLLKLNIDKVFHHC